METEVSLAHDIMAMISAPRDIRRKELLPVAHKKWKHRPLEDREIIQSGLEQKLLLKEIAYYIGKRPYYGF